MTVALLGSLEALRLRRLHRLAQLYTITRVDGTVFRFTDHDRPIEYRDPFDAAASVQTWEPITAFETSAEEIEGGLRHRNLEVVGVIASAAITEDDLRAGKYDKATIDVKLVDWRLPFMGALDEGTFYVKQLIYGSEGYRAEVVSMTSLLTQPVGETYDRHCAYELFDARCKRVKSQHKRANTTVNGLIDAKHTFQFNPVPATATPGVEPLSITDGYFAFGEVQWLTGDNAGLTFDIYNYLASPQRIILMLETPKNIKIGDTFDLWAGCDKTYVTCRDKFLNIINFGGFAFIPDSSQVQTVPRRNA